MLKMFSKTEASINIGPEPVFAFNLFIASISSFNSNKLVYESHKWLCYKKVITELSRNND